MTIETYIDENDLLTCQLYYASKSKQIKKKRQKNRIIIPILYTVFALILYFIDKSIISYLFFIFAILWYFLYPIYERRRYIKHYTTWNKENSLNKIGKVATIEFSNEFIITKEGINEGKLSTAEINEINEIATAVFVKLKTGNSIVLAKNKIKDFDQVISTLKELASFLNIKYNVETSWKWK